MRTDVYTSAGVMTGLLIIWLAHFFFVDPKIHWIDPVAAILVALFILRAAWHLTSQSLRDLMDVKLPVEEEQWVRSVIASRKSAVHGFHQLRTRRAGNLRFVEFHIKVDPKMTVEASHNITRELKLNIREKLLQCAITIHIEPCDGNCSEECAAGCLLPVGERPRRAF